VNRGRSILAVLAFAAVTACQKAETAPLYEKVAVARRDVVVTAIAQGVLGPLLTFNVKSKAWGQILEMPVQTGDEVRKGQLLARIDPRIPQQNLTEAQATLDKARAQLTNATAQLGRSEALFKSQSIAETDYDGAKLAAATAQAAVASAEANLQTAQDAMDDTHLRAPIRGTVLELDAVLGTVISSPTLGGGTVILKMANLDTIQDSVLVGETDVGRVQPGMLVTITVDAYPNQTFDGTVRKIQPQAQVVQNATQFPVLVAIPNPAHLLKPGMNTQVRIHTGERQAVLAVPNAALRIAKDVASGAVVLGLDPQQVQQQLTLAQGADTSRRQPRASGDAALGNRGTRPADSSASGATFTTPSGMTIHLPPGVTPAQVMAAFTKRRNGEDLTPAERSLLQQVSGQVGRGGRSGDSGGRQGGGRGASNSYMVFALRAGNIVPVPVRTGLTDLDYSEVTSGLTEKDTVLVLPSASLVQSQQQFKQRFQNVTGGGLPGLRQQQSPGAGTAR